MTRGSRIVAIDAGVPEGASDAAESSAEAPLTLEEEWAEPPAVEEYYVPTPSRAWLPIVAGILAALAVTGWTGLFFIAHQSELLRGGTVQQWATWLSDWSVPILLVAVAWLLAMRNSRREASRFGDVTQGLARESAALEARLTTINGELSLAREFIAAQSRDLESLGRVASERLSQHASQLASLVADNGTRVETLGSVSAAALENMEKLRGQLPVIASSAKDVTNTIAAAGRTAHSQIEDLIGGFNRLNQFGQASERQVAALTDRIDAAIAEFTRQTEQLDTIAGARFAALAERGEAFRGELDAHEVAALAGIRTRANALASELTEARSLLDAAEEASLVSLRARLSAVRDEGTAIGRALRDAEAGALEAWRNATSRLVDDLRSAIGQVSEIDEQALESARHRLAELAKEAEDVDLRLAERDRAFAEELERRRSDLAQRHEQFGATLNAQMEALDLVLAQRRAEQEERAQQMLTYTSEIAHQLDTFGENIREAAAQGGTAQNELAASLATLAERLAASREALAGTDRSVLQLTDNSVRLLELIQASVTHASADLPAAMSAGEAKLVEIEARTAALRDVAGEAESRGAGLLTHITRSDELLGELAGKTESQAATLSAMQQTLTATRGESLALAEQAQAELKSAIEALAAAARDTVGELEGNSAAAVKALAERLAEQSGAAIDAAVRARTVEVAEQLEGAAARASGVSREAAIQLRDQLAKVNELAGNLERRVAQTRQRAEEQVDNDFARRVALITEALNSNAIDIARAMDADVSDTAWAAYLKGDRGVFTRRAVRLLEPTETKAITRLFQDEPGFREHVSRYIHDFEAMLRQLLSTRDGHALGVTLLSSDMGKLYVALAQAIERLRN
ncbi:MAG: ATPase [Sphingomonadaceae bacterium]|nr:ATPase [Sphingomonadaceae bacterium]